MKNDAPRRPGSVSTAPGFTLLEVVLAMTALALVAAVCYGAFHLGIRAVVAGQDAVVTAQRLRVASDVLIRQIKSTAVYCVSDKDESVFPYFIGGKTSLSFVTQAGLRGGGSMVHVVYQVCDNPPRLVVLESPFFSADTLAREPDAEPCGSGTTVLDGFRSLGFQYIASEELEEGEGRRWTDEWNPARISERGDHLNDDEEDALPAAVKVTVEGLPGLESPEWVQQIPIVSVNGEHVGECDEDVGSRSCDGSGGGGGVPGEDLDDDDDDPDPDGGPE